MLSEFDRFVTYERTTVGRDGDVRTYHAGGKTWRLYVDRGDEWPQLLHGDTVLTDVQLSEDRQRDLRTRGVHWLDLRARKRSDAGSPLTEELAAFLGRYGIRLARS